MNIDDMTVAHLVARGVLSASGCLEWSGSRKADGYGQVRFGGRVWRVTRLVWTLANGPMRRDEIVRHRCDNPPCFLLEHLESGSRADNMADMVSRGRMAQQQRPHLRRALRKLRREDVAGIFAALDHGESQRSVAARFGVCQQHVSDVWRGKRAASLHHELRGTVSGGARRRPT